jgi:hypothetical protein
MKDEEEELVLTPNDGMGSHRTGTVGGSYAFIKESIGFEENISDDPHKVEAPWTFEDQHGRVASVWCYKESKKWCTSWSSHGDNSLLKDVFGYRYHKER